MIILNKNFTVRKKQSTFGIALIMLFLSAEFRPLLPWFDYYANIEYIKEVLCVNKDKESMKCDGKCYLRAKLKDKSTSDQSSKNESSRLRIDWDRQTHFFERPAIHLSIPCEILIKAFKLYAESVQIEGLKPPLPPPRLN